MRKIRPTLIAFAAALCCAAVFAHDEGASGGKLGDVHFATSCNAAAQKEFDLAMAYFHSFAWDYVGPVLDRTLKADPACGMVHWARALSSLDNPFAWPANVSAKTLQDGAALVEAARRTGLATQREKDYVDALATFFDDADKLNHATRAKKLESAMGAVAAKYTSDTEALILHSLVLSATFDPADKQYTNQLRAARQLEPVFKGQPQHPGAAHYLIHSYDYPPLAAQGLDAAHRYSKIAPSAAHAQHMPSHIFTRVGAWEQSVAANAASAKADTASGGNTLHAFDYMVYAHLQLGQQRAAEAVRANTFALKNKPDVFAAAYGYAAVPARVALERGDWKAASQLPLLPESYPWQKYPQAEAANAFARGLGAAAVRDTAAVDVELARLTRLQDRAAELKIGYWVEQIAIQQDVVRGWAAFHAGDRVGGTEMLRKAAAREDATEKHVVSPGPLLPARELLATALLQAGNSALALREFEAVLAKEPKRLRAMAGVMLAAEKSGDTDRARRYGRDIEQQTAKADVTPGGLELARQMVMR